jgi:hypothetical protein
MFPGQERDFLDNRVTTVKRVFQRMLPALIPTDPTDSLTREQRFAELLEILRATRNDRLWLAVLSDPSAGPDASGSSSLDLAARPPAEGPAGTAVPADILHEELRVLLAFWLEMPLHDYLEDLESAGPSVARAIRQSRPAVSHGMPGQGVPALNLKALIAASSPAVAEIPSAELIIVLKRLKLFAKRVHRATKHSAKETVSGGGTRRETSMPIEIAEVLYNLAGAVHRLGVKSYTQ